MFAIWIQQLLVYRMGWMDTMHETKHSAGSVYKTTVTAKVSENWKWYFNTVKTRKNCL